MNPNLFIFLSFDIAVHRSADIFRWYISFFFFKIYIYTYIGRLCPATRTWSAFRRWRPVSLRTFSGPRCSKLATMASSKPRPATSCFWTMRSLSWTVAPPFTGPPSSPPSRSPSWSSRHWHRRTPASCRYPAHSSHRQDTHRIRIDRILIASSHIHPIPNLLSNFFFRLHFTSNLCV